jgi:hypothetical protein
LPGFLAIFNLKLLRKYKRGLLQDHPKSSIY